MLICGTYVSVWDEGACDTKASICTESKSITECELEDSCEIFEHHQRDYVKVEHCGKSYELEAEDAQLTEKGVQQFDEFLSIAMSPLLTSKRVSYAELAIVETTRSVFSALEKEYDVFKSSVSSEFFIDTSSLEGDAIVELSSALKVNPEEVSGLIVLVYNKGREQS